CGFWLPPQGRVPPKKVAEATSTSLSVCYLVFATWQGCLRSASTRKPRREKKMTEVKDVYSRITAKIIADLEQGVRPWFKPWNADHAAGKITRPLRHNGIPYKGINVVMLWSAAVTKGYACPLWLTFKQAIELGGHVRKGEGGELIVYANSITRTETDGKGEETEREIPYMKGYTVFNAGQCGGLPAHYYAKAEL